MNQLMHFVKVTCMCICRQIKPFSYIVQLKMQLTRATAGLDRERINFTLPETSESESFKYSFKLTKGCSRAALKYTIWSTCYIADFQGMT